MAVSYNESLEVGVGLRAPHYREIFAGLPEGLRPLSWFEVISENFFPLRNGSSNSQLSKLLTIREHLPISLHGVGLSIGSAEKLDQSHLDNLSDLVEKIQPETVSDHLSWGGIGGRYVHDLLPMPLTMESLRIVSEKVEQVQDRLKRPILLENISAYFKFESNEIGEPEFFNELCARTGCGVLLDVNNLFVNSSNHSEAAECYLARLDPRNVGQYHLGGYSEQDGFLLDTHSEPVHAPVWRLFDRVVRQFGTRPTLLEWDENLPDFRGVLAEATKVQKALRLANNSTRGDIRVSEESMA